MRLLPVSGQDLINGHQSADPRPPRRGSRFAELSDGFASATDPAALQAICDPFRARHDRDLRRAAVVEAAVAAHRARPRPPAVGPGGAVNAGRWRSRAPWCSTRRAGPHGLLEALVADNLDIGRPEVVELLIFRRGQPRGRPAAGQFKTKIVTYGTKVEA